MTEQDIITQRLHNQGLLGKKFEKAQEVVNWLGAVQSQDFAAAKWALALRLKNGRNIDIEKDFNEGKILRTHVMRPTWHFVMPRDICWMLNLTAPRVRTFMGHYNRKLKLDEKLFTKSNIIIAKALQHNTYLSRQELKTLLEKAGISTDVQRLAHIIMETELTGLICSGPRVGKQFTYALTKERAPKTKEFNREESITKLALKYFLSHGPAQVKDFAWWSGLSMKDAIHGIELAKKNLTHEVVNGKEYWFNRSMKIVKRIPSAFLLSVYDEYVIAYKDRSLLNEKEDYIKKILSMGNAFVSAIIVNGKIVGTWKRVLKKDCVEIKLNIFRKLQTSEKALIEKSAEDYGTFMDLPVRLHY